MWYQLQLMTEKDHLGFEGIYEDWIYSEKRSEVIPLFIMQYYCRMGDYKHEGAVKSVRILSVRSTSDVMKLVEVENER